MMPRGLWRLSVGEQLRSSAFGPAQAVGLWASSGREQTRVEEIVDDLERVRTRTHLAGTLQLDNERHVARDLPLRVAVRPPGPDVAHSGTVGLEETYSRIRRFVTS